MWQGNTEGKRAFVRVLTELRPHNARCMRNKYGNGGIQNADSSPNEQRLRSLAANTILSTAAALKEGKGNSQIEKVFA